MNDRKPLNSILVKPSSADCNLDCHYCFYLKKSENYPDVKIHRMPPDILEAMVRQLMQGGADSVSFGWQGGEPTLMGLDFYIRAVEFQKRYGRTGQSVGNGLQTNGILLNEEWCKFLREYNFLVGLSLDGPPEIHDRYRRFKGGQPSHDRTLRAARLMEDNGVEFNILTVINDVSSQHPDQIWDYLLGHGWNYMQFIQCVEPDPLTGRSTSWSATGEAYGRFLIRIFDRWLETFDEHGHTQVSIRLFDTLMHSYLGLPAPTCTGMKVCGQYVVVEHNGDVYSCDFYVQPQWKLGNLLETPLADCLNGDRQRQFGLMKTDLPPECPDCEWLIHCYGGCTKDRLNAPEDGGSNHFCQAYKMFFAHADEQFKKLARQFREEQRAHEQAQQRQEQERARQLAMQRQQQTQPAPPRYRPIAPAPPPPRGKVGRNDPCPCGSGKKYKKCCAKK